MASPDCRILVVGNPANTNALILKHFAPKILPGHTTAMSRLDHNRMIGFLADKFKSAPANVKGSFVMGNHSMTQVPIFCHATVDGKKVVDMVKPDEIKEMMETIRFRGEVIIKARGKSSAASASQAVFDHIRDWHFGTNEIVSVSMEAKENNKYGVPKGLIFSFPCKCVNGEWQVVDLDICDCLKDDIQKTIADL